MLRASNYAKLIKETPFNSLPRKYRSKNLPINKNIGESPALLLWFGFFLLLGTEAGRMDNFKNVFRSFTERDSVPTLQQLFPYLKSITYAREQISRELHLLKVETED